MQATRIDIKKGLDIPLAGAPEQVIHDAPPVSSVGVLGTAYIGLKPSMMVEVGDRVKLGQPLMEAKNNPGVLFTAPAAGRVTAINRGARRSLQSIAIEIDGDEEIQFESYPREKLGELSDQQVRDNLARSGLWTALRSRPYSKIPMLDSTPAAIFITAIDTRPHAPDPAVALTGHEQDFIDGLTVLSRLTQGELFLCKAPDAEIPQAELPQLRVAEFSGPHPAGLPGTHIHFLKPVSAERSVWHIGYQDVVAFGKLFTTGRYFTERVISLAGPVVRNPRLLRTRLGASLIDLVDGELTDESCRVISGSVLAGHRMAGWANFHGRYFNQVTVIEESKDRQFMGWIAPGLNKFSALNVFISALQRASRRFAMTTTTNGSLRAMVPIGNYEKVMPLDTLPTQLLKYLLVKDTDMAQQLGALELDEEDVALCSFVCVGKYDFGPVLRENLELIEAEG